MKKTYRKPCVVEAQGDVVEQLLGASGNLHEMERGATNIFGDVDDWDDAKERKSDNDAESYGSLW